MQIVPAGPQAFVMMAGIPARQAEGSLGNLWISTRDPQNLWISTRDPQNLWISTRDLKR